MDPFDESRLRAFSAAPTVRVKRIARGLSSDVALVSPHQLAGSRPFIVKHLSGETRREIDVYRALHQAGVDLLPQMLGEERLDASRSYLYLEYVRSQGAWPWRDLARSGKVLEALARLHRCDRTRVALPQAQYEARLAESAQTTLELAEAISLGRCPWVRPWLRHLRRMTAALPQMRAMLLADEAVAVHGDAHTGNVQLARRDGGDRVVLLDWSQARIGHGLEDVSSWLLSLGFWEPQAQRRHDSLLGAYRVARGQVPALTPGFRRLYWAAAASNALAGALRYHLWVADPLSRNTPNVQARAQRSAEQWLKVLRRATACVATARSPSR
jgi:aminoglycoside phosphotransferase (APT) family kinase protein